MSPGLGFVRERGRRRNTRIIEIGRSALALGAPVERHQAPVRGPRGRVHRQGPGPDRPRGRASHPPITGAVVRIEGRDLFVPVDKIAGIETRRSPFHRLASRTCGASSGDPASSCSRTTFWRAT